MAILVKCNARDVLPESEIFSGDLLVEKRTQLVEGDEVFIWTSERPRQRPNGKGLELRGRLVSWDQSVSNAKAKIQVRISDRLPEGRLSMNRLAEMGRKSIPARGLHERIHISRHPRIWALNEDERKLLGGLFEPAKRPRRGILSTTQTEIRIPKNWEHAAGVVWPILVDSAKRRSKLFYEDLAPHISTNNLNVGRALRPIQAYCLDSRHPPLTSIVVKKQTGLPGDGFIAWNFDDLEAGQEAAFDFDWSQIENPYGGFSIADTIETLAEALVAKPQEAIDVYRKVQDRGVAQFVFRAALMKAYDCACAMCRLTFDAALEACHIVPWTDATLSQRLDVRNGLLLCSTHHALFDNNVVSIRADYALQYSDPDMEFRHYTSADKAVSVALHGKKLHLPGDRRLWPSQEAIILRNRKAVRSP
jgi:putative restriction endonuclease